MVRNLDIPPKTLGLVSYIGVFTRNGKEVYRATMLAGINLF